MSSKKQILPLLLILTILLLGSCAPVRNVAYFQKLDTRTDTVNQNQRSEGHQARIKPLDLLSITVITTQPETSKIFNLFTPQISELTGNSIQSIPTLQTYLVDNDGTIDFPVLGKLTVEGLTRKELVSMLQEKLASSFNKELPIITIRITNFAVNIVGEVMRPGKYNTLNDRMTIFEGLAMAGDLTIYGKRENVKVLRENANGTKNYISVNLNDKNVIYSPGYYLEQNDVVYVEPNSAKSRSSRIGSEETLTISAISILISITSLLVNILK
jgi:polysaccharide export outer membrane protein